MKIAYIYIAGIFIFIFTIIIIVIISRQSENFINVNTNIYLTREETANIIKNDSDNYIKSLSPADLFARDVSNSSEYIYKIIDGCLNFTENQIKKLNTCSNIARNFFDNKYAWKFCLIDEIYEEGFPHTRMDIVFLSPKIVNYADDNLIRILMQNKRLTRVELIDILKRHHDMKLINITKDLIKTESLDGRTKYSIK